MDEWCRVEDMNSKCSECGHDSDDHDNGGCSFVTEARKNGRPITVCPCELWEYEAHGASH